MRLSRLQSVICQLDLRNVGLSAARPPKSVSISDAASSNRPSSEPFDPDSFSRVSSPLRSPFAVPPVLPVSGPLSCQGPVPHRGIIESVHSCGSLPGFPLRSVLRFSQPLDGFLRSRLRGFIAPRNHVQGLLRPGGSPDPQPSRLVAGPCPRAVVARTLTDRSRLPCSNASTSRPCSVNRCVPRGWGLAFPSVAPLFGFLLLQVLLTHHGTGSPAPPLVTFPSKSCHEPEST
jgi:hypothetical protein